MVSGGRQYSPVLNRRGFVAENPVDQREGTGRFEYFLRMQILALGAISAVVVLAAVGVIFVTGAARGAGFVIAGGEVEPRGQTGQRQGCQRKKGPNKDQPKSNHGFRQPAKNMEIVPCLITFSRPPCQAGCESGLLSLGYDEGLRGLTLSKGSSIMAGHDKNGGRERL